MPAAEMSVVWTSLMKEEYLIGSETFHQNKGISDNGAVVWTDLSYGIHSDVCMLYYIPDNSIRVVSRFLSCKGDLGLQWLVRPHSCRE